MDTAEFDAAVAGLDYPMFVVTTVHGGERAGCMGFTTQASVVPPRMWSEGPGGVPLPEECSRRFVGRILDRLDFGDHTGFLLDPFEVKADDDGPALGFSQVVGLEPGHEA